MSCSRPRPVCVGSFCLWLSTCTLVECERASCKSRAERSPIIPWHDGQLDDIIIIVHAATFQFRCIHSYSFQHHARDIIHSASRAGVPCGKDGCRRRWGQHSGRDSSCSLDILDSRLEHLHRAGEDIGSACPPVPASLDLPDMDQRCQVEAGPHSLARIA